MKKLFIIFLLLAGCKKENTQPEEIVIPQKYYEVTMTCYSENPYFFVKYQSGDTYATFVEHQDTIYSNTLVRNFIICESNFIQMQDLEQFLSDSIHIRVEHHGKKIENGLRIGSGMYANYFGVTPFDAK